MREILEEFVFPHVDEESVALEIGSGGGRVAVEVAPRVRHLYCLDISEEMLKRLRHALSGRENVSFVHVRDARLPRSLVASSLDFVYSFDVFVHLDLHTMWRYMHQIADSLKSGGAAFIHTANLLTDAGWARFSAQDGYTLEGHYFVTPEVVGRLANKAGLRVEKESTEDPRNFYKARDYLVLLRK